MPWWQIAPLEAGGIRRVRAALSRGGFSGWCCGFMLRCVIAATAGIYIRKEKHAQGLWQKSHNVAIYTSMKYVFI